MVGSNDTTPTPLVTLDELDETPFNSTEMLAGIFFKKRSGNDTVIFPAELSSVWVVKLTVIILPCDSFLKLKSETASWTLETRPPIAGKRAAPAKSLEVETLTALVVIMGVDAAGLGGPNRDGKDRINKPAGTSRLQVIVIKVEDPEIETAAFVF